MVFRSCAAPDAFWHGGIGICRGSVGIARSSDSRAQRIGFFTAAVKSGLLVWLTIDKHGAADRAIHEHGSGWLIRIGEIFTGPFALVLRLFGLVPLAAISFLIGALVSRFGGIAVGKVSGADPESVFAAERL